jgi:S1-C subfamily serine protease
LAAPSSVTAQDVGPIFDRVKDAVVVIYTTQTDYANVARGGQPTSVGGLGSGAVISPTEILTAAHVVQAADQVWVEFTTGDTIEARVRAADQASDVALLELSRAAPTAPVVVGDSDQSKVGDEVFVVGAPLGQTHTLTVGHISARRANPFMFTSFEPVELFQTDAAINPGNSGGPMFTMDGELIGVVSHILSTTGGFQGLGYAVTSNQARATLEDPNTHPAECPRDGDRGSELPDRRGHHNRRHGHGLRGRIRADAPDHGRHAASDAGPAGDAHRAKGW